jgi:hypothetical protein
MAMYHFEFVGRDGGIDVASEILLDVDQAKDHCRDLFEGLGRATGILCIRVRVPQGQVVYSWPENLDESSTGPAMWMSAPLLANAGATASTEFGHSSADRRSWQPHF